MGFAGSLDPPLKIHVRTKGAECLHACIQVQVHACIQEHTHTPRTHIAQINGVGGVLWFVFFGRGRLVAAVHKDDGSDPPTIIV